MCKKKIIYCQVLNCWLLAFCFFANFSSQSFSGTGANAVKTKAENQLFPLIEDITISGGSKPALEQVTKEIKEVVQTRLAGESEQLSGQLDYVLGVFTEYKDANGIDRGVFESALLSIGEVIIQLPELKTEMIFDPVIPEGVNDVDKKIMMDHALLLRAIKGILKL